MVSGRCAIDMTINREVARLFRGYNSNVPSSCGTRSVAEGVTEAFATARCRRLSVCW